MPRFGFYCPHCGRAFRGRHDCNVFPVVSEILSDGAIQTEIVSPEATTQKFTVREELRKLAQLARQIVALRCSITSSVAVTESINPFGMNSENINQLQNAKQQNLRMLSEINALVSAFHERVAAVSNLPDIDDHGRGYCLALLEVILDKSPPSA